MRRKKCYWCNKKGMISKRQMKSTIKVPYGSEEGYSFSIEECDHCGISWHCSDRDRNFSIAEGKSGKESFKNIKEKLEEYGISIVNVERVFGLGIGSMEKKIMKNKMPDQHSLTILRIILEYPNMLNAADKMESFVRYKYGKETIVTE